MTREEALVKSKLECTVIGMTHEVMEMSSVRSSLDFFLGKVSLVMRNKEWKYSSTGCTGNSGGNDGCNGGGRRVFASHEETGEDPGVVGLDRA